MIAVNRPVERTLDDGTSVLDLGISFPNDPAASQPLVLTAVPDEELSAASAAADASPALDRGVQISQLAESGPEPVGTFTWSSSAAPDDEDFRWDGGMRIGAEESGLFMGVVPSWLPDPRVVLYSEGGFRQADGSVVHGLEVPLYPAPTDDGRLLYTVWIPAVADDLDGFVIDVTASFAIGSDGAVVPGQRCATLTLDECAAAVGADVYAATALVTGGTGTLRIETATDVRPVETVDGPAYEVQVQVGDGWDGIDQALTYVLSVTTVGEMAPPTVNLTPEERATPAVLLDMLAPDGSTVMGGGGSVGEALASKDRNPIWMSSFSDHEVYVIGIRPPALAGATFELVVVLADREVSTPLPTFRVPGLDADVFFVALTDPEVNARDWPTVMIVVTAADGTTSMWSLHARELTEAVPETPKSGGTP